MIYTIGGQEFNLVLNVHTMEALEEEFGDLAEATRTFQKNRKSVPIVRKMFRCMANSGRWLEGKPEDVTGHEIDRLGLKGLDTLSQMINATMEESLHSEVTGGNEADDEVHDLVLEEIERQEAEKNG